MSDWLERALTTVSDPAVCEDARCRIRCVVNIRPALRNMVMTSATIGPARKKAVAIVTRLKLTAAHMFVVPFKPKLSMSLRTFIVRSAGMTRTAHARYPFGRHGAQAAVHVTMVMAKGARRRQCQVVAPR